jgi:hypothetical protein
VRWQRYWRSGNPGDSVLGRGWSLFWESRLEPYQDGLVARAVRRLRRLPECPEGCAPTAKAKKLA